MNNALARVRLNMATQRGSATLRQCCDPAEGNCPISAGHIEPQVIVGSPGWLGALIRTPDLIVKYAPRKSLRERLTKCKSITTLSEALRYTRVLIHMITLREVNLNKIISHYKSARHQSQMLASIYSEEEEEDDEDERAESSLDNSKPSSMMR